jgi:hypothetical protein
MQWHCPACSSQIPHNPADTRPDPNDEYRCVICHLDLRFDLVTEKMEVAPFHDTEYRVVKKEPRTIPPPPLQPRKRVAIARLPADRPGAVRRRR